MKPAIGAALVLVPISLFLSVPAHALEILQTEVAHSNNRYTIHFAVRIDAPAPKVRALMTDYARLARLSDAVVSSQVLARRPDGSLRLRMRLKGCILFFCKTADKVEDVGTEPNGDIVTRAVPNAGDFTESEERWRIIPEGKVTQVTYTGMLVPAFYVPPFIGPTIMKYKIKKELGETVQKLETLARRT